MKRAGASLENQNKAAELAIRHRRQAGQFLIDSPELSSDVPNVYRDDTPSYKDLKISRLTAQRLRDGARVSEQQFEEEVDKITKSGKELTAKGIEKMGRRMRQAEAKPEWSASEEFPGSAIVVESDAIQYLQTFNPGVVDLLLTDPPYATDVEDISEFARSWLTLELSRVAPTGRAYIFVWRLSARTGRLSIRFPARRHHINLNTCLYHGGEKNCGRNVTSRGRPNGGLPPGWGPAWWGMAGAQARAPAL